MFKEIIKNGYLLLFSLFFNLFKLCPVKKKITFVISFVGNPTYLYEEIAKESFSSEIIFLCKPAVTSQFRKKFSHATIFSFESSNIIYWLKSIYHLATSKVVIIDNYFAFLSAIEFNVGVECIQLWHAAGALKTFGLKDHSISLRKESAKRRFRKVYTKFNKIIVGSEEMASIFMDAFDVPSQNILRTGIPRTDFFYDNERLNITRLSFYEKFPMFKEKKVILYAPTFRDHQLDDFKLHLDLEKMYQELKHDHVLLIKLHPAVKSNIKFEEQYPDFIYDFSSSKGINGLLVIVDYLITDYSSIPFEFALLKRPMIFFPYDLDTYKGERGVIDDYELRVPGPICFETEEIINTLINNEFNLDLVAEFSDKWNEYSDGNSSKKLSEYVANKIR
jgi:teichoic acid glycerol-phosphate primase